MKHASLFSGIGGFDLAAKWMGWENVMQCEIDPFCQRILHHHFPSTHLYGDIREINGTEWRGKIDILTGGFPCQPFSAAGRRRGTTDDRFLWPEMLRVIREIQPTWIVAENVRGIVSIEGGLVFERVCAELEENEYEIQPFCIPASSVGAPHQRYRMFFIAHSPRVERERGERSGDRIAPDAGCERRGQGANERVGSAWQEPIAENISHGNRADAQNRDVTHADHARLEGGKGRCEPGFWSGFERCNFFDPNSDEWGCQGSSLSGQWDFGSLQRYRSGFLPKEWIETAASLCRVDDGLSRELDGITVPRWRRESLKAYGNAIVPQVAFEIFKAISVSST